MYNRKTWLYCVCAVVVATIVTVSPTTYASHLNGQINQLERQNSQSSSSRQVLENEAVSLEAKVATLRAEISNLEKQVADTQSKSNDVQLKLSVAQTELARQQQVLGDNIKQMYVEGGISALEMLASSRSLSDYFDREQYRSAVQNRIKESYDKIAELKLQLKGQKDALDKLLSDQQHMQTQLDGQRGEQQRLLSLNESQRSDIENQIRQNNSKLSDLRRQQATENARIFSGGIPKGVPGGGGYPGIWAFAPMDSIIDSWGMYNRECVSYTAWKVADSGRYMPYWGGRGNAKQWDDNARAEGIPVSNKPRAGDVAISNAGIYGHTMYVEAVYGDGSILVSDYNQQWDGNYRIYVISATKVQDSGFDYIHF